MVYWMLVQNQLPPLSHIHTTLRLLVVLLQTRSTQAVLAERGHVTLVCTAIRTVHQVLSSRE